MKRSVKRAGKRRKRMIGAGLTILILAAVMAGAAAAKYIFREIEEPLYTAEAFYFESDLLGSQIVPSYTYSNGVDTIQVSLYNYVDALRYAEGDITYTVTLTKKDQGTAVDTRKGTIPTGEANEEKIEFSDLPAGSYVVTAKAEGKYEKELKANFELQPVQEEITYSVSDSAGSPVLLLKVTTKDYSGKVKIAWPDGVAPDSTDPYLAQVDSGYGKGECVVEFANNSEYSFKFFKKTPASSYTKDKFTVGKGE